METPTSTLLWGIIFFVVVSMGALLIVCVAVADLYPFPLCHGFFTLISTVIRWGAHLFGR